MPEEKSKETVKQLFIQFLETRKLRKTPERFAILEKIYTISHHFDIENLYEAMIENGYRVSKATVYNTIDLLVEANLVRKHQFGSNLAQYERAYNTNHHHLICMKCGKVREIKDLDLMNTLSTRKFNKFSASYYTLYVYGICSRCNTKEKKERKNKDKDPTKLEKK